MTKGNVVALFQCDEADETGFDDGGGNDQWGFADTLRWLLEQYIGADDPTKKTGWMARLLREAGEAGAFDPRLVDEAMEAAGFGRRELVDTGLEWDDDGAFC